VLNPEIAPKTFEKAWWNARLFFGMISESDNGALYSRV
jgi:hypothetical protein